MNIQDKINNILGMKAVEPKRDKNFWKGEPCPDCGVKPGKPHKTNCDIEQCSICKKQRLSCGCKKKHDKYKARWQGKW